MTPTARLALAVVLLAVTAGCLGDGEAVRASGSPATIEGADAAGLDAVGARDLSVNATITVTLQADVEGRESQDVVATVPVRAYRSADGVAVVAVAASPYVEVIENPPTGGDPLSERDTAALLALVQDDYAAPEDVREVGTESVTALGERAEMVRYAGTARRDGERREVVASVVRVRHEGDVVTVVGVRPAERDGVLPGVLSGLRH